MLEPAQQLRIVEMSRVRSSPIRFGDRSWSPNPGSVYGDGDGNFSVHGFSVALTRRVSHPDEL